MKGKTPELKHRRAKKRREAFMALMFLMPSLLGLIFLSLLPMVISMVASLTDWEYTRGLGNWNYVGTKNFVDLFSDSWFIKSLENTIVYTIGTVPVGIFIALVIATLIDNFCSDKIAGYVRIALYMPNICNVVAVSVIWMALYSTQGPITNMVRALGWEDPPRWLANYHWALPSVMVVAVWAKLGYNVFMYGAAMAALPRDLYEAADLDGANFWQEIIHITIPSIRPTIVILTLMSLGSIMKGNFDLFYQLVGESGQLMETTEIIDTYV